VVRGREAASNLWLGRFGPGDRDYYECIHGKTVAIVGPAPPGADVGAEIDTFDLVVRTNYRLGSNDPACSFGARTDIAYYNNEFVATRPKDVLESAKTLRWAAFKTAAREL